MKLEPMISNMMTLNTLARLWHWMTDIAQHHTTYEQFLTQNETLTDSLMESALGNEVEIDFSKVGVTNATQSSYSIGSATTALKSYRSSVLEMKSSLENLNTLGSDEFITILDDVVELTSKTLYLLRLK